MFEANEILSARGIKLSAERIGECQTKEGMICWFPGGHADPWNHVEAAMALVASGHRKLGEAAYQWLADNQRPDGSWHQYYIADEQGQTQVKEANLDANTIAYVASGTYHHFLHFQDRGFLEAMWPVVERAMGFVLALQQPRGEILWARHPSGKPWPFALLAGSCSIYHSLGCALTIAGELGYEKPDWELSTSKLSEAIRLHPDQAFAPKRRWAMDWYYPVLAGVISGEAGRLHLANRFEAFNLGVEGIKCVSDRPWVTTAETCETAVAHLGVGEHQIARQLFFAAQNRRLPDGNYVTGVVFPQKKTFPPDEHTSYSAAAVILAAEALEGKSPASKLFADPDVLDPADPDEPAFADGPEIEVPDVSEACQPHKRMRRATTRAPSRSSTK